MLFTFCDVTPWDTPYLLFLYISTQKDGLALAECLHEFWFWAIRPEPTELELFHKTEKEHAHFLRTLYLYYNFYCFFKKLMMFTVMFINWKEKPEVELFLRTV